MLALGLLLVVVAVVVSLVGSIMFLVAAFRVSLTWGLLVLLVPFAALVFLIKYWEVAKRAFLVSLVGSGLCVLAAVVLGVGTAAKANSQFAAIAAQMQAQADRQTGAGAPVSNKGQTQFPSAARRETPTEPRLLSQDPERILEARGFDTAVAQPRGTRRENPNEMIDPGEIRLNELGRHIGKDLVFVDREGHGVRGRLASVDPSSIGIEREIFGGTVLYTIARANLREVRIPE